MDETTCLLLEQSPQQWGSSLGDIGVKHNSYIVRYEVVDCPLWSTCKVQGLKKKKKKDMLIFP